MIKKLYKSLFSLKLRNEVRIKIRRLQLPLYAGNNFTCNCCNKSFSHFVAKGSIEKRKNAECPNCGSLERTRLLLFFLRNETNLFNESLRLLHFAPEECLFKIFSKLDIDYIDGDIDPSLARHVVDISDIHYPDQYFDLIICSHVLGHVKDERKAIQELKRVLKKDGVALLMTRINFDSATTFEDETIVSDSDRLKYFGETDAWRLYGCDFQIILESGGFLVKAIDYRKTLGREISEKFSLGDGTRELIFYCTKKD